MFGVWVSTDRFVLKLTFSQEKSLTEALCAAHQMALKSPRVLILNIKFQILLELKYLKFSNPWFAMLYDFAYDFAFTDQEIKLIY